jgi:hypothetical protein
MHDQGGQANDGERFSEDADAGFGDNVSRDVLATRVRRTHEHAESWSSFCVNSQEI